MNTGRNLWAGILSVFLCPAKRFSAAMRPENRQYGPDTLHGTFFLYGDTPEGRGVSLTDEQIAMYQEYFPQPVPAAVSFEVRSAADMKEFMNLMFGKGWDMDTGAAEDMEAGR